jgi:fructose-1,6-bisphosphatase/inositol monophosphatase family enzyme
MQGDLSFMHEVADEASALAMRFFATGTTVQNKPDQSPVTEADLAVERLVRTRITERFPSDAIIGEEYGSLGSLDAASRTWIVDPIDGTSFFAKNDPNWRIHLALQVDQRIELAAVAAPALGLRWWAQRGAGAFEAVWPSNRDQPRKLRVSSTHRLNGCAVACAPEASRMRLPIQCGVAPVSPLPLVELVRGEIDAFVAEGYFVWDHAPWILLVQEAGGRFTDRDGSNSGDRGGGVYSNEFVHDELVRSLDY